MMKKIEMTTGLALIAGALGVTVAIQPAVAQSSGAHADHHPPAAASTASAVSGASTAATAATAGDRAEGEVRKIDKAAGKLTLRHGEIKRLDMPGMTMVFGVRDAAWLDRFKIGDKVLFDVERGPNGFVVTAIDRAP